MRFLFLIILLLPLSGCGGVDIQQYAGNSPEFRFFEYFQGKTKGWGIVRNRGGELTRQFVVVISGKIDENNNLVLEEEFEWSDGESSRRVWTVTRIDEHTYTGEAGDVVGTAQGEAYGNAIHWRYHLNVKAGERNWKLFLDDWMFLQPNDVLINTTAMSKWGIHLGDITIVFSKGNFQEK